MKGLAVGSSPAALRAGASTGARGPDVARHLPLRYRRWVPVSFAVAALSLIPLPDGIGYDPWSWMVWGRELDHATLVTAGAASSIKPLPVFVDALLAPFGGAAVDLWLVCARAGTVLGLVLAYHLATQLAGRAAGVTALIGWFTAHQVAGYLTLEGMSEPTAAALVLAAVDAHLGRRRWSAVILLAAAALIRIELWPFVAVYGLVSLFWRAPRSRRDIAIFAAVLVAIPLAWILPDAISSGDLLRSAQRATQESQGGPLVTAHPGLSALTEAGTMLLWPFDVLFVADAGYGLFLWARRRQLRPTFLLACGACALVLLEAAMVELRVATGAPRYLLPSAAVAAVVAGCAWANLLRALPSLRPQARAALLLAAAWVLLLGASVYWLVGWASNEGNALAADRTVDNLARELPAAVSQLGGRSAVLSCGTIGVAPLQNPAVAWYLGVSLGGVGIYPSAHGVVFENDGQPSVPNRYRAGYRSAGTVGPPSSRWTDLTTCDPAAAQAARRVAGGRRR